MPVRLEWLSDTLATAPDHPTVVAMHHPPVANCMWWMEYTGLGLSDESVARLHDTPLSASIFVWDGVDLTAFQVELEAPRMSIDMEDLVNDWPAHVEAVRSGGPVPRLRPSRNG